MGGLGVLKGKGWGGTGENDSEGRSLEEWNEIGGDMSQGTLWGSRRWGHMSHSISNQPKIKSRFLSNLVRSEYL